MLRNFFICLFCIAVLSGCGDEGLIHTTLSPPDIDRAPAAPPATQDATPAVWQPDAIEMRELIYPYAAKQCVGQHDVLGDGFVLAECEVLYKSRRVRASEQDNRWVRLSTGHEPAHATNWTHNSVPQFLYIFLNFQEEADYQRFDVGIHNDVPFTVVEAFSIGENTWELHLMYSHSPPAQAAIPDIPNDIGTPPLAVETPQTPPLAVSGASVVKSSTVRITATATTGYFFQGGVGLNGVTLTGVGFDADGNLILRAAAGQQIQDALPTPVRLVLTQRSGPTRDRHFGRRIEFTHANIEVNGNLAYIRHAHLSANQSKDLQQIGADIAVGDIFHLYVYQQ